MPENNQVAPSNIVINGVEYSPDDAQSLIELGNKTREAEQKWNTKLDSVWPEYGKLSSERTAWQKEKEDLTKQLQEFQAKQNAGTETPDEIAKAKEAARKLGLTLNEDLDKSGYVKKDDLDKYLSERDQKQAEVKKVLEEADKYEQELTGEDGRPKFNKRMVLAWANSYNIPDLMEAYKDMHKDELAVWEKSQIDAKKGKTLTTFKPGGKKEPAQTKVDDSNVKQSLHEALYGQE